MEDQYKIASKSDVRRLKYFYQKTDLTVCFFTSLISYSLRLYNEDGQSILKGGLLPFLKQFKKTLFHSTIKLIKLFL